MAKGKRRTPPGGKRAAQAVEVSTKKRPHEAAGQTARTVEDGCPTWRFAQCDLDGPWAWDPHAFRDHLSTLREVERKTWAASAGTGTKGCVKRIPVDNLCAEAQRRLEAIRLDDFDAVWEIRLSGPERFWGIRLDHCFSFLWWDPEHTVCPSSRR